MIADVHDKNYNIVLWSLRLPYFSGSRIVQKVPRPRLMSHLGMKALKTLGRIGHKTSQAGAPRLIRFPWHHFPALKKIGCQTRKETTAPGEGATVKQPRVTSDNAS